MTSAQNAWKNSLPATFQPSLNASNVGRDSNASPCHSSVSQNLLQQIFDDDEYQMLQAQTTFINEAGQAGKERIHESQSFVKESPIAQLSKATKQYQPYAERTDKIIERDQYQNSFSRGFPERMENSLRRSFSPRKLMNSNTTLGSRSLRLKRKPNDALRLNKIQSRLQQHDELGEIEDIISQIQSALNAQQSAMVMKDAPTFKSEKSKWKTKKIGDKFEKNEKGFDKLDELLFNYQMQTVHLTNPDSFSWLEKVNQSKLPSDVSKLVAKYAE